jgi:hypothetical protein
VILTRSQMLPLLWAAALGLNNSQLLLVWMV